MHVRVVPVPLIASYKHLQPRAGGARPPARGLVAGQWPRGPTTLPRSYQASPSPTSSRCLKDRQTRKPKNPETQEPRDTPTRLRPPTRPTFGLRFHRHATALPPAGSASTTSPLGPAPSRTAEAGGEVEACQSHLLPRHLRWSTTLFVLDEPSVGLATPARHRPSHRQSSAPLTAAGNTVIVVEPRTRP